MLKEIKCIYKGEGRTAFLCEDLVDNTLLILKKINIKNVSRQEQEEAIREAEILKLLKHPNIIQFKNYYFEKNENLCIVMDYADGGDLGSKIKNAETYFSEEQILNWFVQICLALKHMHDRKIVHRDLKSSNIFLTSMGYVKLGDFGISSFLSHTNAFLKSFAGTYYYLSPEIIKNEPYNYKTDIWSLGVVLYEICALQHPFNTVKNDKGILEKNILCGQYKDIPLVYSDELKYLISILLTVNSFKRPAIKEILQLPIIRNRIKSFLSENQFNDEFSHTVIHQSKLFYNEINYDKIIEGYKHKEVVNNNRKISPPNNINKHKIYRNINNNEYLINISSNKNENYSEKIQNELNILFNKNRIKILQSDKELVNNINNIDSLNQKLNNKFEINNIKSIRVDELIDNIKEKKYKSNNYIDQSDSLGYNINRKVFKNKVEILKKQLSSDYNMNLQNKNIEKHNVSNAIFINEKIKNKMSSNDCNEYKNMLLIYENVLKEINMTNSNKYEINSKIDCNIQRSYYLFLNSFYKSNFLEVVENNVSITKEFNEDLSNLKKQETYEGIDIYSKYINRLLILNKL